MSVENFKQIEKSDVWAHLQEGKRVFAVVFKSKAWQNGLKELWYDWSVRDINKLLSDSEKNIIFFEEIEV